MKWQRVLRMLLVVVAIVTLAGIFVSIRKRPKGTGDGGVRRVDPKAVAESARGRTTQATGMKIPGYLEFARSLTYDDGSLKFVEPRLFTNRSGRDFVLTGKEASLGANQSHMDVHGNVVLTANDGLKVTTEDASYSSGEEIVRAPKRVDFTRGTLSGSGMGMSYDQKRDVLWLLDQAVITVAADKDSDDPGASVHAGTAGLARREKYMRFERTFTATRAGRTMTADTGVWYLTDDLHKIKAVELRSHSSIALSEAAAGGLQRMDANDMNITYGPDGETIQRATLAGAAAIQMAGSGGKPGRQIIGENIDVTLGPDGAVTAMLARDKVQLTIPADGDTPARVIRAPVMEGRGEAGKGLTGATFHDNIEFRELRQPNPRLAHSRTLIVALSADGGLDDARFAGGTKFEDGTTVATALDARYLVAKGRLELTGLVGPQPPQVQDARISVVATKIDMAFEGPKMIATGAVQSVMKPQKKEQGADGAKGGKKGEPAKGAQGAKGAEGGKGGVKATSTKADESGKTEPKTPGMLKDDQPANVTANSLDYDGEIDKALYTGSARLWQGDTAVSGDTITIDEKTGDLYSHGSVRSSQVLDQLDSKTNEHKKVPSVATADDMHYEDALNRVTYTTDAHMVGPQGDLRAVKIELYMVEGGGSLDRVEAYDQVNVKTDERTGTGTRLTYLAPDEKYILTGTPTRVVETENCRVTTGKSVTFWRGTDRILVDGLRQVRTLTTNPGTCTPTGSPSANPTQTPTGTPTLTPPPAPDQTPTVPR